MDVLRRDASNDVFAINRDNLGALSPHSISTIRLLLSIDAALSLDSLLRCVGIPRLIFEGHFMRINQSPPRDSASCILPTHRRISNHTSISSIGTEMSTHSSEINQ
jgi:hypothetical protein